MMMAHVTNTRWLLTVLSVALLLAACGGDEADTESAVDIPDAVMIGSQSQGTRELPGKEALQYSEEQMGFPVIMPEVWPWEDITLTSIQMIESPMARPDHTGNEIEAFYEAATADSQAIASVMQRYYPGSQGSEPPKAQMASGEPVTFSVDEHTVHALPVGANQLDFVLHAGEWTFVVSAHGERLPPIEGFEPMLRSLIAQAEAAAGNGS